MSDNRQSLSDLGAIAGDQEQAQQPAAADAAAADTAVEAPAPVVAQPVTPLREQEIDKQARPYPPAGRREAEIEGAPVETPSPIRHLDGGLLLEKKNKT